MSSTNDASFNLGEYRVKKFDAPKVMRKASTNLETACQVGLAVAGALVGLAATIDAIKAHNK
jgi:hypothetical protein